jgi:hypothetical protein
MRISIEPTILRYQKLKGIILRFAFSEASHCTTNRRKKINCAKKPKTTQ